LKGALAAVSSQARSTEIVRHDEILSRALTPSSESISFEDIELPKEVRNELLSVVEEFISRWELKKSGIPNRSRLLFVGPPGCGKSATAKALAKQLMLPLFVLRFDALIGSYLGQTAQNLRTIFDFIQRSPSIVLIDEIDAISSSRGGSRDIAELDRVVISLMQQLELVHPAGLLICTSNLPESIDSAVMRRFDSVTKFPKPTQKQLRLYGLKLAQRYNLVLSKKAIVSVQKAVSFAAAERLVVGVARKKILDESREGRG
jgi:SpoVK/Ycf46/Vps4 family AAA+-type ATPase